jgi:hypothetical protein
MMYATLRDVTNKGLRRYRFFMEREASILRNPHRELLLGEREPSDGYERKMKTSMRERIRDGILDFSLLFQKLPAELRQEVFRGVSIRTEGEKDEKIEVESQDADEGEVGFGLRQGFHGPNEEVFSKTGRSVEQGMIDAVAFFYVAAEEAGINRRELIEQGVETGERQIYDDRWIINSVDLDVDRDVQHSLAKRALQKISDDGELSNAEIRALLESDRGKITPDQIQGYLNGEWRPSEDEMIDPSSGV